MPSKRPCGFEGCQERVVWRGYCDEHLRQRLPAEWARRHGIVGRTEPRLRTDPVRKLTRHTTLGPEVTRFAREVLGVELLPWQEWWLKHALELDTDGGFRFRTILTLVARQNGKTTLLMVLALAFMYLGRARMVLGSAQSLDIAKESWQGAVDMAEADAELAAEIDAVRRVNGEQELRLTNRARYRIAASTRSAGRGLSVDLLILDELREHRSWDAWAALSKTTLAKPNALTVAISNAGDDQSVVLNNLRAAALAGTDSSLALFEWSAPDGCALDDRSAMAQANPGMGRTISVQALESSAVTDTPAVFRTEVLCQKVDELDSAIDPAAWRACTDAGATLDGLRDRVTACVDIAPDGAHVSLVGAAESGGRVWVEPVMAWSTTEQAREQLPEILAKVEPAAVAWFPAGPAAALAPVFRGLDAEVIELRGQQVAEACMGFVDLVTSRRVVHNGDPLLSSHVSSATKYRRGDGYRFARRGGAGHVDAVYAAAGAVQAALTLPAPKPRVKAMVV